MDTLVRRVHDCPKAEGFNEILMPGELEARLEAARTRTGIPYNPADMAGIQREAAEAGLPPLAVSDKPITA
jgi:LDH2 family malate/lactate/ureidoglycolate dehydrogenase